MLKNYLKVAWRHLVQHKGLSFINIFGLAIGMAFAILIGLWIQYETSFDKFHVNRDRVAIVLKNTLFNNQKNTQNSTPLPLYYAMKSEYPEVKHASRMSWNNDFSLAVGDKKYKRQGIHVDPDFLRMFTFPLVKGSVQTALSDPNAIVITEAVAKALFGSADPINKIIKVNNEYNLKVTGVLKDVPVNSSIQFDFLAPFERLMAENQFYRDNKSNWGNNFLRNVVELREDVSMSDFSAKIKNLNIDRDNTLKDLYLFLHPLAKWNLYNDFKNWQNTGGKIQYIRLFGAIGIFVLLIACINFMNLATARSENAQKRWASEKPSARCDRSSLPSSLPKRCLPRCSHFCWR